MKEDIIRMAREVGLWPAVTDMFPKELERFAALVAAAERKACAKVCDEEGLHITASIIRARGKE
jgi:hypothetical protein